MQLSATCCHPTAEGPDLAGIVEPGALCLSAGYLRSSSRLRVHPLELVAMRRPRATAQRPGMNSVCLLFASSHMGFRLQLSRVRSAYIRACARVSCLVGSSYGMPCAASCSCKCFQLTSDSHLESCLLMSEDSRRAWMQSSCTLPAPASMHSRARLHMKLL